MRSIVFTRLAAQASAIVWVSMTMLSCATPSRIEEERSISRDVASAKPIDQIASNMEGYVRSKNFTLSNCSSYLDQFYQMIYGAEFGELANGLTETKALATYERLFAIRAEILEKYRSWHGKDLSQRVPDACVNSVRTTLRAIRVVEDYLATEFISPNATIENPNWSKLLGPSPGLVVNPMHAEFRGFDRRYLKSGDVILSRGNAFTSATISRLGDVDYPFSHAALIYLNEKENKFYTIEAHIEIGSVVGDIVKYLGDDKVRATVLRYHDSRVAAEAARQMFNDVKARQDAGKTIPYDFALDGSNDRELFCSELVATAYRRGTNGAVQVPMYESSLSKASSEFKQRLGILVNQAFLPGDLEVDPRFTMVAEWRDIGRLRMTRARDVALTQMLEWMSKRNYQLQSNVKTWIARNVVQPLRHWPIIGDKLLGKKFPNNMSKSVLATMSILQDVSTPIIDELSKQDEIWAKRVGRRMTPREMTGVCERIRENDYGRYVKGEKTLFHKLFHP